MPEIALDEKNSHLEIISYNGNSEEIFRRECNLTENNEWNFFRENDNCAYIRGKIAYEGGCQNNLIISPYQSNNLNNVKNAFVFVGNSFIEISPISDISNSINKGKRKLSNQEISYHIPKSVSEMENLDKKDLRNLEQLIYKHYGIASEKITMMPSKSKNRGIYYLEDKKGERYVFKLRSKDKTRAELLSEIVESVPNLFPKNYRRLDSSSHVLELSDGLYGLESFVEGETKERNLDYFSLLGKNVGLLHRELVNFLRGHQKAREILNSPHSDLSESNIISAYLDLNVENSDKGFLLSELERIIDQDISYKTQNLTKSLIHKDLNQSNILWVGEGPVIIDSESIDFSTRINEFAPALLLQGNRNRPNYVRGSLQELVNYYNKTSNNSLSIEEESVLPALLKYSLIKYYVVRNIRRNVGEAKELEELEKDLNKINQET
ncbi:MAG: phosphotransferase [Nanoarchaeota archaeon]|nr:phosphotransferase [Nanoarchaeota archaeon]